MKQEIKQDGKSVRGRHSLPCDPVREELSEDFSSLQKEVL